MLKVDCQTTQTETMVAEFHYLKKYYIKQKLFGVVTLAVSVLSAFCSNGILGLFMLFMAIPCFTNQKILYDTGNDD